MTAVEEALLRFHASLLAPPARVFEALTRAEHLSRWFCDEAESDPRAGGRVVFRWRRPESSEHPFAGEWSVFEPVARCGFTGGHPGYPDGNAGRIEFVLEPSGTGTTLIATHALPARVEYATVAQTYTLAWPRALGRLADYLEPRERTGASA